MRILRQEDGLALPLVLILMVVLALLGTALWHYSMSDLKQAVQSEQRTRAYYVARAGAESVANYLLKNPDSLAQIMQVNTAALSAEQTIEAAELGEAGKLQVKVETTETSRIVITGMAAIDAVNETVSVVLDTHEMFDGTIYSLGSMTFHQNATVTGDLVSGGSINPPDNHTGSILEETYISFPPPIFPEEPDFYHGELLVANNDSHTVETSPPDKFQKTNIGNNATLSFNTTMSNETLAVESKQFETSNNGKLSFNLNNSTTTLVADEISIRGLEITGTGAVEIYVRSKINIQTPLASDMQISENAILIIYLDQGCVMEMLANSHLIALVYGPEATVEINGNADFTGAMIVEQLKGNKGNITIGSAGTGIEQKYNWDQLGLEYGGYWIVHWLE